MFIELNAYDRNQSFFTHLVQFAHQFHYDFLILYLLYSIYINLFSILYLYFIIKAPIFYILSIPIYIFFPSALFSKVNREFPCFSCLSISIETGKMIEKIMAEAAAAALDEIM